MKSEVKKWVLANAIKYDGKANPGSVIGSLMQQFSEKKDEIKKLMPEIQNIVKQVNSMSLDEQREELELLGGVERKEKVKRGMFDFLGIKEGEKVVSSFPPGPEKYPHIGHAKALILNYLLAEEYGGKFRPRFEDTNPELVKKEFYDIMLDNFKWLGVDSDFIYASDSMEDFYFCGKKLINKGEAYVCYCQGDDISTNRKKGKECSCRNAEDQLDKWEKFFKAKAGSSIVRLKIDMNHKNSTMRDPAIFRIIDAAHARQGKKYRVWPTYDFQNSIVDGMLKVTNRLRTKEFEMRAELHRYIQRLLGFKETQTYEFARFNMEGVDLSGRKNRELIEKGKLLGWDDPRLATIVALRRRGFLPEAIKEFVISTGITKSESTVTWGDLILRNKRILDSTAKRYFFVENPKKIKVIHEVVKTELPLHPTEDYGFRKIKVGSEFYVADKVEKGFNYRFMHLFNFKDGKFVSKDYDPDLKAKLIHWLPMENLVDVEVFMDNGKWVKGKGEADIKKVKVGEVIQFERFGFVRLDEKKDGTYRFWFTHR